jgi:hypothetical protein
VKVTESSRVSDQPSADFQNQTCCYDLSSLNLLPIHTCPLGLHCDDFTDCESQIDSTPSRLLILKAQINFDCDDQICDWMERMQFWDSIRPWFLERGYTLYNYEYLRNDAGQIEDIAYVYPAGSCEGNTRYPHSYFGGDPPNTIDRPLSGQALVSIFTYSLVHTSILASQSRIIFAQDSQCNHVAIKLVKNGSQEYQISKLFHEDLRQDSLEDFKGILPPVDFLPLGDHWFIVTPRYGMSFHPCWRWSHQ